MHETHQYLACRGLSRLLCARSLPFDFVKTRIQKMEKGPDGKYPYKSSIDCAVQTFTKEGPLKFYTGFPTYCVRCAPFAPPQTLAHLTLAPHSADERQRPRLFAHGVGGGCHTGQMHCPVAGALQQCSAKCPFYPSLGRLPDYFCDLLDLLSHHFTKHWPAGWLMLVRCARCRIAPHAAMTLVFLDLLRTTEKKFGL